MRGEPAVIFGIREVSWPKREGYMYVQVSGTTTEKPLILFHLYKAVDDEFERLLNRCLKDWVGSHVETTYLLENFSARAEMVFRNVWGRLRPTSEDI